LPSAPGPSGACRLRGHTWLRTVERFRRLPNRPDQRFIDFLYRQKVAGDIAAPLRRQVTDKLLGKAYIETRLGPGHTVQTLAVLDTAAAIADYRPGPDPVAVKPTHSSGRKLRITSEAEWIAATPEITGWLEHDYFRISLEPNYHGLARRVIVEPWLDEVFTLEGSVHCRAGVPKVVSLIERYSKARQSYTTDRRPLGVSLGFPTTDFQIADWEFWDPLLADAARLAAEFSYIRVDFYTDGQRILFGELTNLPAGGLGTFHPEDGEKIFSEVFFSSPP
jgi:TupA-like ATPgrasp